MKIIYKGQWGKCNFLLAVLESYQMAFGGYHIQGKLSAKCFYGLIPVPSKRIFIEICVCVRERKWFPFGGYDWLGDSFEFTGVRSTSLFFFLHPIPLSIRFDYYRFIPLISGWLLGWTNRFFLFLSLHNHSWLGYSTLA